MGVYRSFFAIILAAIWASGAALAQYKVEEAPLKDWAVGILAADWRDGNGRPITAFENARIDLAEGFAAAGFDRRNITGLSLRPMALGGDSLRSEEVFGLFEAQAQSAQAGCVFYFTSHGMPEGLVLGTEGFLTPSRLNELVDQWCGTRPTVVIVSACYSGVFVPVLSAPHRMIMAAARADRTSFGCSAEAQYPYFDGCILTSLPIADDFVHLASLARRCVAQREQAERLTPPSEPVTQIGADVDAFFVFLNFDRPAESDETDVSVLTLP